MSTLLQKIWPRKGVARGVLDFFRLLRWENLAIMALTEWLVFAVVMRPAFQKAGVLMHSSPFFIVQIMLATALAAASGNIINDFFDQKTDSVNRPERQIVGQSIGPISTWIYYQMAVVGCIFLAVAINRQASVFVGELNLWLFPTVAALLFLYSKWLKCTPIFGNVLIAVLCAAVPMVPFFQEKRALEVLRMHDEKAVEQMTLVVLAYAAFAFLTTFLREMVKDLEDQTGDRAASCATFAVVAGQKWAKILAAFAAGVLFVGLFWWSLVVSEDDFRRPVFWAALLGFLVPASVIFGKIWMARTALEFRNCSFWVKILMAVGLVFLGFS